MTRPPRRPPGAVLSTPSAREIRLERSFRAPRERVWRALTDPTLVAQWWGRGNRLVVERLEVVRGGRWRFVEHADGRAEVFEGRFREVEPPARTVQTFEWGGMPGPVIVVTTTLDDLPGGGTRLVSRSLFHTREERDGMLRSGMKAGADASYDALDRLLDRIDRPPDTPRRTTVARTPQKIAKPAKTVKPAVRAPRAERRARAGAPRKVTPFLMFDDQLEAAIELYTRVFPGSKVRHVSRAGPRGPVTSAEFVVGGQTFLGYNGGPHFRFSEGFSLFVDCADQAEVDRYWERLVAAGAKPTRCGWIDDPFGLSWQIVPRRFMELMSDPDPKKVRAVVAAMMKMTKLDVAGLEAAYARA